MDEINHLISMVFKKDFAAMKGYVKAVERKEQKHAKEVREIGNAVRRIIYS